HLKHVHVLGGRRNAVVRITMEMARGNRPGIPLRPPRIKRRLDCLAGHRAVALNTLHDNTPLPIVLVERVVFARGETRVGLKPLARVLVEYNLPQPVVVVRLPGPAPRKTTVAEPPPTV